MIQSRVATALFVTSNLYPNRKRRIAPTPLIW